MSKLSYINKHCRLFQSTLIQPVRSTLRPTVHCIYKPFKYNYTISTKQTVRMMSNNNNNTTNNNNTKSKYPTVHDYLQQCHSVIQYINQHKTLPDTYDKLHIVIGNEASDLDSMVSALITGYYHTSDYYTNNTRTITVTLCNITKNQFILRGEASYAFSKAQLTADNLLFLHDHINLQEYVNVLKHKLGIILVDHNKLAESQLYLNNNIVGIYDHHVDSEQHTNVKPRIIEYIGSCTTLPTYEIIQHKPELLTQHNQPTIGLCKLIECVILIDCDNMSSETKKAKQKDIDVLHWLDNVLHTALYKKLKSLRSDVSMLTTEQLLQRDTKFSINNNAPHAIASLPISLQQLHKQDTSYIKALDQYCQQHKLSFVIVLTSYKNKEKDQHERQLLVYMPYNSSSDKLIQYITSQLESNDTLKLQRIEHPQQQSTQGQVLLDTSGLTQQQSNKSHIVAYNQCNIAATRKQVLPLVDNVISKL